MPTAPAYPEEFRRPAVDLITRGKRPIVDAARRLGVDAKTLRKWVQKYRPATASPSVEQERRRRREENRQLKMERDILKKLGGQTGLVPQVVDRVRFASS